MYIDRARSWTYKDIEKIVSSNTTEYKNLEFKSLGALVPEAKDEISKDVSSFANSAGGIIIYGIKEVKEGPTIRLELEEGLDPNGPINKEWLENIIVSRISPRIEGLYINPVKLPNEKYILVVVIPQSTTAHMAGNNRYYKRHNFKSEPMEDYEVRDVMNRLDKPRLFPIFTTPKQAEKDGIYKLQIVIRNIGETFVRHFAVRLCIPEVIIRPGDFRGGRKIQLDGLWYREFIKQSNPNQYIFPGFRTFLDPKFLPSLDAQATKNNQHLFLYWTLYTDKSGPQDGRTPFEVIIRNRLNMDSEN
ncbi:MAG: helix-turn-helix domain-containing protein [Bacillota bacterium]|nr:ATP-binding protein [Thermanaerosceptrum fracticalcis]